MNASPKPDGDGVRSPLMRWTPGPEAKALADLWSGLTQLALAAVLAFALLDAWVPPQHLPWKPLRIADPVGRATAGKVARLKDDPGVCLAVLREGGIRAAPAPERDDGGFCVVEDAVRVRGGLTAAAPSDVVMRCPLAVGLAIWERHELQPAARETLGSEVRRIDHFGTYACRRMYGASSGRPSEHARANAFDVSGVRLADGRRVTVAADWPQTDAESRFLRRVREGACRVFQVTLSPDYNRAHADHLHLDMGPWRACR